MGYSGDGDIDISPHLDPADPDNAADASLFWGIQPGKENAAENRERDVVVSDLSADADSGNLLQDLAQLSGWIDPGGGSRHAWEKDLEGWADGIDNERLGRFVLSLTGWFSSWPNVHVSYVQYSESRTARTALRLTEALSQASIYRTAENLVRNEVLTRKLDVRSFTEATSLLGFILWRRGRYREALKVLRKIIEREHWKDADDIYLLDMIADSTRFYLETAVEMMQVLDATERSRAFSDFDLDQMISNLMELHDRLDELRYLSNIAVMELNHMAGKRVELQEVKDLFDESFEMEEWSAAALAAQFMLSLSLREGIAAAWKISGKLIERKNYKLAYKCWARAIYEALGGQAGLIFTVLNTWPLSLKLIALELFYFGRRKVWDPRRV